MSGHVHCLFPFFSFFISVFLRFFSALSGKIGIGSSFKFSVKKRKNAIQNRVSFVLKKVFRPQIFLVSFLEFSRFMDF